MHIIESDVQILSKQIYVLGMMKLAESLGLITDQQYGARNKRQCQSAYINKICYYDISRQKDMNCAFLDDDTKACYDRIVTRLSEVEVRKWGVSKKAAAFTTKFLHQQEFFLRTAHGTTTKSYKYTESSRIQGSGQGIGWAGPRWTVSSDTVSNIMARQCTGMKFSDPTNSIEIKRNGDFFVDDLDIGVTEDAIKDKTKTTLTCLQEDEQIHSLVLNGIGHCLNPIKTSYYDIVYKRDGIGYSAMSSIENPGTLQIQVEFDGDLKTIKRLEPYEASKALGVYLAPNGKYRKQYEILDKKLKKWARNVKSSSLTPREKLVAYHGYILRGIIYILSATNFTKEQCDKLQKILSPILYNAYRVQRHASRIPLYTPKSLGGYGIVSIYHLQGVEKLKYYLMHNRLGDTTGDLLKISTRFTQLELGISTPFWQSWYKKYSPLLNETWTTDIWRYLDSCGMRLMDTTFWNYKLPRRHDFSLMDAVMDSNLSILQKQIFNQVRLYMKVISADDLIDHKTRSIKNNVLDCSNPMTSKLGFPYIKPFPTSWVQLWQSIIKSLIFLRLDILLSGQRLTSSHLEDSYENVFYHMDNTSDSVVLEPKDISMASMKFHNAVQCIKNNIDKSPKWMRHIWGESTFTATALIAILKLSISNKLAIATDASVNEGHAAHAFCFSDKQKGTVIFSSESKVEGPA